MYDHRNKSQFPICLNYVNKTNGFMIIVKTIYLLSEKNDLDVKTFNLSEMRSHLHSYTKLNMHFFIDNMPILFLLLIQIKVQSYSKKT